MQYTCIMKAAWTSIGAVGGALLAHVPCCAPTILLALSGLGIGGAGSATWLHGLEPYKNWFLGFALVNLAVGFFLAYRKPSGPVCEVHAASKKRQRLAMWGIAAMTVLVMAAPRLGWIPEHTHAHASTVGGTEEHHCSDCAEKSATLAAQK